MRSSTGHSRLRPVDERIISSVLSPKKKNSICQILYLLLGITALGCEAKSQLEKGGVFVNEMSQRIQHLSMVEKWEA